MKYLAPFLLTWLHMCSGSDKLPQTNLLYIMFDDLRPDLSVYGREFMVTPNFDRLAKRSVVFDYAFCQIAVCNPSRDSLMTGLRPDSVGTYNFQHSYTPHIAFPTQLARSGYNTAGFGKILHWEGNDRNVWNFDSWENDWYGYQGREWGWMNASNMPDKIRKEEDFRDHQFTDRALQSWKRMLEQPKPFMLAIGYKLPHICVHMPHKYYELYKGKQEMWKLPKKALRFPYSTSEISYRCCADSNFHFMNQEGGKKANRSVPIGDINMQWTNEMHDEMMMGYCGGISFVDKQVGRLLDFMDARDLWKNTTVVLTADHGMHNGEKGIWEKWTLFDEATRVPLIISHPKSPHQGEHYKEPVELVDIYATVNELLHPPKKREQVCEGHKCKALQGKSLAPVVLGRKLYERHFGRDKLKSLLSTSVSKGHDDIMPVLEHDFAISQALRCAKKDRIPAIAAHRQNRTHNSQNKPQRQHIWEDCNVDSKGPAVDKIELSLLGYSMRSSKYRYTAYFYYNRTTQRPDLVSLPYEQELYDHRNETLAEFTHRETSNLAYRQQFASVVDQQRKKLISFIKEKIPFGDY